MSPESKRGILRDVALQLPFLLWLVVLWMLLWHQFTPLALITGLLVAIFVSNLPEAVGSSTDMLSGGRSKRSVLLLWLAVSVVCAAATGAGYLVADLASSSARGAIDGFAAGALLTMLIDSMAPEAQEKARDYAGLLTVVGFATAAGLSLL